MNASTTRRVSVYSQAPITASPIVQAAGDRPL
jgi:hypothetical protein